MARRRGKRRGRRGKPTLGIKVDVGFKIAGDLKHRYRHLEIFMEEVSSFVEGGLTNDSDEVACTAFQIATAALEESTRLVHMSVEVAREETCIRIGAPDDPQCRPKNPFSVS
ncbi:MAG: hypothetical protein WD231_02890 [Candidatus Woykebacteria bacterium]